MERVTITGLDGLIDSLAGLDSAAAGNILADALNHTANQARLALQDEVKTVFDRPTKFTIDAFRVIHAKPNRPAAAVFVKDEKDGMSKGFAPEDWFKPQSYGGSRELRRSEQILQKAGILPAGMYAVPGAGARLDAHGNMSRGQIQQILSGLMQAESRSGYTANASSSRRSLRKGHAAAFFVIRKHGKAVGIAERRDKAVRMVLVFVRSPEYSQRFDFEGTVERVADESLEANIDTAIAKALSI